MNNFPSQEEVINAILEGMITAQSNYSLWIAHELYLSYAPKKFLTTHIAQELAKMKILPEIFMDAKISDILKSSLKNRDSYRLFMAENNISQELMALTLDERFEHQNDNDCISRVIINVKNGVRNAQNEYQNNIEVLCKLLNRDKKDDSSLDYGLFAFYLDVSSSARKKSQKRLEEIISTFDEIVLKYKNLKSTFKGGDINHLENIGEWCVGCYIIEPK